MNLVTGATGLAGSWLLLELSKRGEPIRALKQKNSSLEPVHQLFKEFSTLSAFDKIEWTDADLTDILSLEPALEGVSVIYHTAGYISFDDRDRRKMEAVNVEGTANLVNEAIVSGVKKIIHLSSIAVLDKNGGKKLIDENSNWDPELSHSEYAISKKRGEMEVWRGSQEGLNAAVIYPSIIIGSFDGKRESEKLFRLASRNKVFATGGETGYVDIRDLAKVMVELAHSDYRNESYVMSADEWSYAQVLEFLRKDSNLPPVKIISDKRLNLVRKLSKISKFFGGKYLSKASFQGLTEKVTYSNDKIKEALSFEFIPVDEALTFHFERFKKLRNKNTAQK